MSESMSVIGQWRITEMDNWDQEAVDLVQPGFIELGGGCPATPVTWSTVSLLHHDGKPLTCTNIMDQGDCPRIVPGDISAIVTAVVRNSAKPCSHPKRSLADLAKCNSPSSPDR